MPNDLKSSECTQLLRDNYIGRLGYISSGQPYIVPITYYFDEEAKSIIGYTSEGHKTRAMRENPSVSVQVDEIKAVKNWKSVQIIGSFEKVDGSDARYYFSEFAKGVKSLRSQGRKMHPELISDFSSKVQTGEIPIVYKIRIKEMIGKFRND